MQTTSRGRLRWRQLGGMTVVDHTLLNQGAVPVRCAAWAITQLAACGTAVLPQSLTPRRWRRRAPQPSRRLLALYRPFCAGNRVPVLGATHPRLRNRGEIEDWSSEPAGIAYERGDRLFVKWSPLHQDSANTPTSALPSSATETSVSSSSNRWARSPISSLERRCTIARCGR